MEEEKKDLQELEELDKAVTRSKEADIKLIVQNILINKISKFWGEDKSSQIPEIAGLQTGLLSEKILRDAKGNIGKKLSVEQIDKRFRETEKDEDETRLASKLKEICKKYFEKYFNNLKANAAYLAENKYRANPKFKMDEAIKFEKQVKKDVEEGKITPEEGKEKYYEYSGDLVEYREKDKEDEKPDKPNPEEDGKPREDEDREAPVDETRSPETGANSFLDGLQKGVPSQEEQAIDAEKRGTRTGGENTEPTRSTEPVLDK